MITTVGPSLLHITDLVLIEILVLALLLFHFAFEFLLLKFFDHLVHLIDLFSTLLCFFLV